MFRYPLTANKITHYGEHTKPFTFMTMCKLSRFLSLSRTCICSASARFTSYRSEGNCAEENDSGVFLALSLDRLEHQSHT